jgi:hypothetical protein
VSRALGFGDRACNRSAGPGNVVNTTNIQVEGGHGHGGHGHGVGEQGFSGTTLSKMFTKTLISSSSRARTLSKADSKAWPHSLPASLPAQAAGGGLPRNLAPCRCVGKHVDLGALAVELLGRDLAEDVGEEHVDFVKLLARALVEGGHGHGAGEHGLLGRDLVEDVHEDADLVKLLAREKFSGEDFSLDPTQTITLPPTKCHSTAIYQGIPHRTNP